MVDSFAVLLIMYTLQKPLHVSKTELSEWIDPLETNGFFYRKRCAMSVHIFQCFGHTPGEMVVSRPVRRIPALCFIALEQRLPVGLRPVGYWTADW